jgi:hypothetical protein
MWLDNKTRSHLHTFKKIKLTHRCFKSSHPFITIELTAWIFFIFQISKIHVSPTDIISSPFCPRCQLSCGRRCHATAPCHAFFPWSQNELIAFTSSSGNASSCRLPSQAETETLNLYHHRRSPSPDRLTHTLHCYKKFISTLVTILPTTQPRIHFASSLDRALHHRSSTDRCRILSLLSHTHYPTA